MRHRLLTEMLTKRNPRLPRTYHQGIDLFHRHLRFPRFKARGLSVVFWAARPGFTLAKAPRNRKIRIREALLRERLSCASIDSSKAREQLENSSIGEIDHACHYT